MARITLKNGYLGFVFSILFLFQISEKLYGENINSEKFSAPITQQVFEEKVEALRLLQESYSIADCTEESKLQQKIYAHRKAIISDIKAQAGIETAAQFMMPDPIVPCPEMQVIELFDIPGFARTDELVICGAPDTLAFLIFIEEPGNISGTQMTATFLPGMQYAGFETTHYGSATISNLDPNPEKPKFLLEGITDGVYIGYIGVEATCDANINAFEYEIDLAFDFIYEDTLGNFQRCRQDVTPIRTYNSVIKEPVINFRSAPNSTISSLGNEFCTNIQISQDGIEAYLTEVEFSICNVDFTNEVQLTSLSANGTPIPYTYNAADSTLKTVISDQYFIGNSNANPSDTLFGEGEILTMQLCMKVEECPTINTQFITYKSAYYCHGDTCQVITDNSEIRIRPTDRPIPIATSTLIQEPGICGAPAIMEMTLQSSVADSAGGIFTDLTFGFETCETSSLDISRVTIGGTEITSDNYEWIGSDLNIDLTTLTSDPDGIGNGITDADGDGFFDDLPGGRMMDIRVELDFLCDLPPNPGSIACSSVDCSFGQFYVRAKRDCGQSFTYEPPVEDFSITNGATYVDLGNQDFVSNSYYAYNFGATRTSGDACGSPIAPKIKTVEFCYVYERENIEPCPAANTTNELQVLFDGSPILVNDIKFVPNSGSLSVNGITTQSNVNGTFTNISITERLLTIPIGALNVGDTICYSYQLEADTAICVPPVYMNGTHQVIETCTTAGCTCQTVMACDVALFRSDPSNCGCECDIRSGGSLNRWNLGYTDATMTEKVELEDIPVEDRTRFLPCDTMYYEGWMTFNTPESVGELYQWYFVANITNIGNNGWGGNDDTELMIDASGTELLGLDFVKQGSATRQVIDVGSFSDCLDDPTTTGATGFFAYAAKTPWSDVTYNTPLCSSTYEYHDGNLFGVYFRNFNKLEDCRGTETASWEEVDCLDQIKDAFNIEIGDTIYMKWLLPLTKNVKAAANEIANPDFIYRDPQILNVASGHFLDEFDTDCLLGLSNCRENTPFQTFCPEEINAVTEVELDDCGGQVEHTFNVVKPTPVNWFAAEYRPFFKMEDITVPMYAPLIYCGNAKVVTKEGLEFPLEVQSLTNHTCAVVDGQEYCTVSGGSEGTITFNPEADDYSGLGVGLGGYVDEFTIVYDLCKICPSESPDFSNYEVVFDYRTCETLNPNCFVCNQSTTNTSNELPNICGLNGATLVNRGQSYYGILGLDTLFRWDDVTDGDVVVTDISNGFPPLTQTQDQNLIASVTPGVSEELNTITICADGTDPTLETHRGMLASVTLTNSVQFVGGYDIAMNPLDFDTVSTNGMNTTYAIFLDTLAPGQCTDFKIGTRLLFCPQPPDIPEICITTTSGCMDRDIMAALAGETSSCNSIETCYQYVFEESGIQADFLLPDNGASYALCDTIPLAVLVKNVKTTTVTDLVLDIDLPLVGMQVIPGTFEASYPNSGNFALPFYSIVDPAINGNNLLYTEDNDFSNAIHSNGLPGVTSAADSNFVVVRFMVETKCDEFISGSQASFQAFATDPCSPDILTSGIVTSNQLIINNANPADYGQVLITAKPSEAFCGQATPTFKITGQNISEQPLGDSVIMCVTLPTGIDYQTGSMRYIIPTNLNVGTETITMINGQTQICFQGYENMPIGGAFTLNFEADFEVDAACGDYDIQVDTKNLVVDESCTDGGVCDVFVQSSVNPTFTMTLKGPLETVDLDLYRICNGVDDPITICYEATLKNPGPDYRGDIMVNLHDDILGDNILDFYDPILGGDTYSNMFVASGDSITVTGCYTVTEINACPVILDVVYDSPCTCNHLATPYASIEPEFTADLPPTTVLCPGQELGIEICGDNTLTYNPASNVMTRTVGDSLYISVIDNSIVTQLYFSGGIGECTYDEIRFIRGVEPFDIDVKDSLTCQDQPTTLELTIPIEYEDYIGIQWTPSTNLDDPTRADPLFESDKPGIYKYQVALMFNGGCIRIDSVCIDVKPIGKIEVTGNPTICYPYETNTFSATAGFDYYEWFLLNGGFEIIKASTPSEEWTGPTEPGNYLVKGFRSGDLCPSRSDTIVITQADCIDLELEKTICEIDNTPNINDTISYQIVVCNRYVEDSLLIHDANMVSVMDNLPPNVSYISHIVSQGTYTPGGGGNWQVGTMPAGTCDTLKITVQLIDYGKIKNSAEVTSADKEDIDSTPNNDDGDQSEDEEAMVMFTLEEFDLALKKILDPSQPVPLMMVGDTITYCLVVENQGGVNAYNISLVDNPPAELTIIDPNWTNTGTHWEYNFIDSILVGEFDTVKLQSILNAVPPDTFAINYAEIIDAEDGDGDHPEDSDSDGDNDPTNDPFDDDVTDNSNGDEDDHDPAIIYVEVVDLALKKETTVTGPVKVGDDIPYTITIYNQGNIPSTNIKISEYIPAGLELNTALSPGWVDMDSLAMITLMDTIGFMESTTVMVTMTVLPNNTDPLDLINVAEITSYRDTMGFDITNLDQDSDGDSDPDNDNVPAPGDPDDNYVDGDKDLGEDEDDSDPAGLTVFDLALKKTTADVGPFTYGDVVTFDFTVYNQGNVPSTNIEVTEFTPCGFEFDSSLNPTWTIGTGNLVSSTITDLVMPGDSATVSINLIVQACGDADAWKNTGEISASEDDKGNDTSDDDTDSATDDDPSNDGDMEDNAIDGENEDEDDSDFEIIEVFDLALVKTIATAPPYSYGNLIEFEITIYNQGNIPSTNITVSDSIPSGFLYDAANNTGWTGTTPVVDYLITDTLLAGDSTIVSIWLELTNTGGSNDHFTNIAEISMAQDTMGMDGADADSDPDTNFTNDEGGEPDGPTDDQTDGNGTDDEDDHDPAIIEVFDLALKKTTTETGPFKYGDVITFEFTVYNQGNIPSTNIEVTEFIPCGYAFDNSQNPTWTAGTANSVSTTITSLIIPGDSTIVSIDLIVQPCGDADAWKNSGEISGSEDDEGNDTTDDDIDSDADDDPDNDGDMEDDATDNENGDEDDSDFEIIDIFDLAQIKQVATPGPYEYGDTIQYNILVFNQGNVPANNITIYDHIPSGLIYDASLNIDWTGSTPIVDFLIEETLAPGASTSIEIYLVVGQNGSNPDSYTNYSEIGSSEDDMGNDTSNADADSTPDNDADNDTGGEPNSPTDDRTDDDGTEDEDDHDPAIIEIFDLALKKTTMETGPFKYGDVVTFDFTVYNQGNVPSTNIEITEYTPCGFIFDTSSNPNWNIGIGNTTTTIVTDTLQGGDSTTVSIDLILQPCDSIGAWKNSGEISSSEDDKGNDTTEEDVDSTADDDPDNDGDMEDNATENENRDEDDSDFEVIDIFDLAQIKQVVTPSPYAVGQLIEYKITVVNQGNTSANNILVTDMLPAGLSFDPANNMNWNVINTTDHEYLITTILAPLDTFCIPLFVTIEPSAGNPDDYTNISEITESEDDMGNDTSDKDADDDDGDPDDNQNEEDDSYEDGDDDRDKEIIDVCFAVEGILVIDAECGEDNGSITIDLIGSDTTGVSYVWSDGISTSNTANNLSPGIYNVTLSNGVESCNDTLEIIVGNVDAPNLTIDTLSPATCPEDNGSATINWENGTAPFTISIDGMTPINTGAMTFSFSDLATGMHSIEVVDAKGCKGILSITIEQEGGLEVSTTGVTNTTCGAANGSASITVSPAGVYTYTWSDGGSGDTRNNLAAGIYTVTVSSTNGCTGETQIMINDTGVSMPVVMKTNLTCANTCNGSITTTKADGTCTIFNMADENVTTRATNGELCTGEYIVQYTDINGCMTFETVLITEPAPIDVFVEITPITCEDGKICITNVLGGAGNYSYTWSGTGIDGSSDSCVTITQAGLYTLLVTDGDGCEKAVDVPVLDEGCCFTPGGIVVIDAGCGEDNGSVTIDILSGDASMITYTWSNGNSTTNTANNLSAGTYSVTLENGIPECTQILEIIIGDTNGPNLMVDAIQAATCPNDDGSVSLSWVDGTAPYSVSINGSTPINTGGTTQIFNNLAAGTYTIEVIDANGCKGYLTINIENDGGLTVGVDNSSDADCSAANGTATISVTPAGTYTYSWSDTETGATRADLTSGVYSVTASDANGCTGETTIVINDSGVTMPTLNSTDNTCPTACDGNITFPPTPGTFLLTDASGATIPLALANGNLCAGEYQIEYTDEAGCMAFDTIVINQPDVLDVFLEITPITCSDGEICITNVLGGTGAYTYTWSGTGIEGLTDSCVIITEGGIYTLNVMDENGCDKSVEINIVDEGCCFEPEGILVVDAACGEDNGSVTIDIIGGDESTLTYTWSDNVSSTNMANNLSAGVYFVTIENGLPECTQVLEIPIGNVGAPNLMIESINPAICPDDNGSVTVSWENGIAPFAISIDGSTPINTGASTFTFSNLAAGSHTIKIVDAEGCEDFLVINIEIDGGLEVVVDNSTNADCGVANGTATITVTPAGTYTYTWSDAATDNSRNDLASGVYTVTATDANGCSGETTVVINDNGTTMPNITTTNVNCINACDGTIALTTGDGTFIITDEAGAEISATQADGSLCAGQYIIEYMEAGCSHFDTVQITQPEAIDVFVEITPVTCSDGKICITNVLGGTGNYTYSWSGTGIEGLTDSCVAITEGGIYTLNVMDENGCDKSVDINVVDEGCCFTPEGILVIDAACGEDNSSVTIDIIGGDESTLTYTWSDNVSSTNMANNLSAGVYFVTIENGMAECTQVLEIPIGNVGAPNLMVDNINPAICPEDNGSVTVSWENGTAPFAISIDGGTPINTGASTFTFSNLAAGSHTIKIVDAEGCEDFLVINIEIDGGLEVIVDNSTNADCGVANGTATITVTPAGTYTYTWSDAATGNTRNDLASGVYTVTASDTNGCTGETTVVINDNGTAMPSITTSNVNCINACDGTIALTTGDGTFTITNESGATIGLTQADGNLCTGQYIIEYMEAGCSHFDTVLITQPEAIDVFVEVTPVTCSDGKICITNVLGGTGAYTYTWSGTGIEGLTDSCVAITEGGIYTLNVMDENGCNKSVDINVIDEGCCFTPEGILVIDAACGEDNGSVTIDIVSGDESTLTYTWSDNVSSTNMANNLSAGVYFVTIENGMPECTQILEIPIGNVDAPNLMVEENNPAICPEDNGSVTVSWENGTAPFVISIDGGAVTNTSANTFTFNNLAAGSHNIKIVDADGCEDFLIITIEADGGLAVTVDNTTDADCNTANGGAIISVNPTGLYSYTWSDGGTGSSRSNLSSGVYTVIVNSPNGCSGEAQVIINDLNIVMPTINKTNASCVNVCDGAISLTTGTGTFTITDETGSTISSIQANGNLCAGSYIIEYTEAGCSSFDTITITQPDALDVFVEITPLTCGEGEICITNVLGGNGDYTYTWSGPSITSLNDTCLAITESGFYTLSIMDSNGCGKITEIYMQDYGCCFTPGGVLVIDALCGEGNGSASVGILNGDESNIVYTWSNGDTSNTATNLSAGTYTVTIENGLPECTQVLEIPIGNVGAPNIMIESINPAICPEDNGSVTLVWENGTAPFAISIDSGVATNTAANTFTFSNLSAGAHSIKIVDAEGCEDYLVITIETDGGLEVMIDSTTNADCGIANGTATISVTPVGTYTYAWSDGGTGSTRSDLASGIYTVMVNAANGCYEEIDIIINDDNTSMPTISASNVSCFDACDGRIDINTDAGVFTIKDENNNEIPFALTDGNLCAGQYTIEYTDIAGCINFDTLTISQPDAFDVYIEVDPIVCRRGTICVTDVLGANGNYTFLWSGPSVDGMTDNCITVTEEATYTLIVSDDMGCDKEIEIFIERIECIVDLALKKTTTETGPFAYGDIVTFDFTVYNQGNFPATNIEITEHIPCGFIFNATLNNNWLQGTGGSVSTIMNDTIHAGDSSIVSIDLIIQPCNRADAWKNKAEITHTEDELGNDTTNDDVDSNPDDDPNNDGDMEDDAIDNKNGDEDDSDFEEIEIFDLALIKQLAPTQQTPVLAGYVIEYQLTIFNQGNVDAFDIEVVDYIPNGLLFNLAANTSANTGNANDWNLVNGIPTYIIDSLAPLETFTITIKLTIAPDFRGSSITNFGEITYGANEPGGQNTPDADSKPDRDNDNDTYNNDDDISGDGNIGQDEDDHDPAVIFIIPIEDIVIIGDTSITTLDTVTTDTPSDVDPEATPVFIEDIVEEVDCSKYPAYCYHGLAIELMPMGMVETWASDVSVNDFSQCPDYQLGLWHESMPMKQPTTLAEVRALPTNLVFTCATLGDQDVQLYITDPEGNWNFCETYINVQDNNKACIETQNTDPTKALLGGQINTWKGDAVEEVLVSSSQEDYMTTQDGFYHFELPMEEAYTLTPQKNHIPLNGVSTFDLVLMTKHILGVQPFDNPYQWIAADVDQSNTVTAFDLVLLRKMILAIDTEFSNNTSWRFVDATYKFHGSNPLSEDFPEQGHVNELNSNMVMDFVAVKIGDINGNVRANSLQQAAPRNSSKVFEIETMDQFLKAGQTYEISFHAKEISKIQGYQFTLNTKDAIIDQVRGDLMLAENFGLNNLEAGRVTVSWNQMPNYIVSEEKLFTIQLQATQDTRLSKVLQLNSRPTIAEAYDLEGNIIELQLKYTNSDDITEFDLAQNQPNPFRNQTSIAYTLPSDSPVELILRDETGRVITTLRKDGKSGRNRFQISKVDLPTGFIYYQLVTNFGMKSKKMLRLK